MHAETGPFYLEIAGGIATLTIDRPPVNAFSVSTYQALLEHIHTIEQRDDVRVVILAAREDARCWCGGADLNDFVGMDSEARHERYEFINAVIPRFYALERPVIAAITSHAIGIGVMLAAACDLRVASVDAQFSTPEVDYGLIAGSSRLLNYLGMNEALVRELAYTGRRASAQELLASGLLNRVVPRGEVLAEARALAQTIATKSLPVLRARKKAFVEHENLGWLDAYRLAQALSGDLVALSDSQEGVNAFLERRTAQVQDS
ncbi:enoyl-CoA hydratase/isomerase family protein [Cryobacterium sp. TMS1-20-1]|uniref:enoyl-CoA hydratase/isomerase family protein n=1 Tax=Cryobacterium sp. TMS1-20-1 TaxID=1259223 RepID=UPI00106BD818|nr:enoyl-CoA hydratase/isomerase family protein [Cryobacterium sp. TMS1-20-1]TFC70961.1 enoyl-CoA hydratase/isomerase family protein [Cryobacterium sp. TMS1-20-1]